MELAEFIKPMDTRHRRSAILRIADACNVKLGTATVWVKNGMPNKPLYKKAINEEFRQEIFKL